MEFSSSSMEFTKYDIDRCLYDVCRTKSLIKAIKNIVKKDDIVVDAGGGSGILGMTAIKFGAKKVYFIETNRRACEVILENAKRNNLTYTVMIFTATLCLRDKEIVYIWNINPGFHFAYTCG